MPHQKVVIKYLTLINAFLVTLLGVILYYFQSFRETFSSPLSEYSLSLFFIFCGALWDGFTLSSNDKVRKLINTKNKKTKTRLYIRQWLLINAFLFSYLFFSRDLIISRLWLTSFSLLLLPFCHLLIFRIEPKISNLIQSRLNNVDNKVYLLGSDSWISKMTNSLNIWIHSQPFSSDKIFIIKPQTNFQKIEKWLKDEDVKYLIADQTSFEKGLLKELKKFAERRGIKLSIQLDFMNHLSGEFEIEKLGPYHLITQPQPQMNEDINRVIKRIFDIIFSIFFVILVLPPLTIFVFLLQKISRSKGKIFFTQSRLGRYNEPFKVYKFRTMHSSGFNESKQAVASDPRIYKGGKLLRKFNIDEIPQFINVLLGHMSVVGPRPHLEKHEREFENIYIKYGIRRLVKPGITGLAQTKGYRGEIKTRNDVRYRAKFDIFYVSNWNLFLDIKIILKTAAQCIFPHRNAY